MIEQQVFTLWANKNFQELYDLRNTIHVQSIQYNSRSYVLLYIALACCYIGHPKDAVAVLSQFKYAYIDETIIKQSNIVLASLRQTYTIIASFDPTRVPKEDEIIIQYGKYPHTHECLPHSLDNRTIYRHPIYFDPSLHTRVEYHPCWEKIEKIYILNLEERKDRYMNLLAELCAVRAPLHRIYHYKAQKDKITGNRQIDAYIGATQNHLDVVYDFIVHKHKYCLVLEDDVAFISNVELIWKQLQTFFERPYEFDLAFLGYSKVGEIKDYDDVLSLSYQDCTTSSAYILQDSSVHRIRECLEVGVHEMKKGGSTHIYCCDRYWCKLKNENKIFLFMPKLSYQHINHSDIVGGINYNFD